ncbi:response regulator [Alkalicoccobacillus porphyridii]|uniref:Response regulator n=1 Tax=Alkalicoccobacillus porphyridii TaxID=2597270 RepID=A0A554A400_9BACI|nr:response regulator [Alkalicoccobacillus porphyridii]TSB48411.1 response regulator [Alkalicoccobacillus porphyridii]
MKKVVIAEDDYRVSLIHERYVNEIGGLEVVGKALNGKELMALLREHVVDLLILDIYFPDQLGIELLPTIRHRYPTLDILIITAATEKHMVDTAKKHGVVHYLIKPVPREKFEKTLLAYVNESHWLSEVGEITQEEADALFRNAVAHSPKTTQADLPTGIDAITLKKVQTSFSESDQELSTEDICRSVGISRTTARRYLEFLVSMDECETILTYGVIGRPERMYKKKK